MKNCVSCKKEIQNSKKFCGYCGAPQPAPSVENNKPVEKEATQVSEVKKTPKVKVNRKTALIAGGSALLLGLLAGVFVLVTTPPSLSKNDVSTAFQVNDSGIHWAGDKVSTSSSMTLKANFSGDYEVALESFSQSSNSWVPVVKKTGSGPEFSFQQATELAPGVNKYRLSIFRPNDANALFSSQVYSVKASAAYLPTACPYKEFIALIGPDANLTMDPGKVEGDSLSCTMYPTVGGDYFIDMTYTKVSQDAWDLLMSQRNGTPVSLGLGESSAYTYSYSDELSGTYDKTIVNYHGIMIDSAWATEGLRIAISAIEVK